MSVKSAGTVGKSEKSLPPERIFIKLKGNSTVSVIILGTQG